MRFKIFILSTLLITLVSGVLFYKNLTQLGPRPLLTIDFDELRAIDMQVYSTALSLRHNLNSDITEIADEDNRIKELLDLINEIKRNTPELQTSVEKIRTHFKDKRQVIQAYQVALKDLRANINTLMPAYNELDKKNIKYVLDKKDFYRECILDAYMYVAYSHKENEMRLSEDQKILGQIISFAKAPNPDLQKFANQLEVIQKRVKQIDGYINDLKDVSIAQEMKVIAKYYQESLEAQNEQNENLLTFMFIAIGIYLVFMIFLLRKR